MPYKAQALTSSATARRWRTAERILFSIWLLAAVITMYPVIGKALHVSGTFFTSHAADLAFPPWFYIVCRYRRPNRLAGWLGRYPVILAMGVLAVGALSEFAQLYYPRIVTGTFDPLDIAAYAVGLAACLVLDVFVPSLQVIRKQGAEVCKKA